VIRRLGRALVRPAAVAVIGLLFAGAVALVTFLYLDLTATLDCSGATVRGSRLWAALYLVAVGVPLAIVAILVVRTRLRLLRATLLAAAAMLGGALVLVGLDSATYTVGGCGTADASFLYFLWGAMILLLALQARRVGRELRAG
jgi:hypothetical protein